MYIARADQHRPRYISLLICTVLVIWGTLDNVSHTFLRRALVKRNVGKIFVKWMCEMFATRTAETNVGNKITRGSSYKEYPKSITISKHMHHWCFRGQHRSEIYTSCDRRAAIEATFSVTREGTRYARVWLTLTKHIPCLHLPNEEI